jgi:dihydroneopterin aldolase
MTQKDSIQLQGITVVTYIGVYDWEQKVMQPVVLDLEMTIDAAKAAVDDNLSATVDYQALADQVCTFVGTGRFKLIESLAEKVADFILQMGVTGGVKVKVTKPGALATVKVVAVTIARGDLA